jgi:hypothetical protein
MTGRADTGPRFAATLAVPRDVPADGPNRLDIERQPANKLTYDISGGFAWLGATRGAANRGDVDYRRSVPRLFCVIKFGSLSCDRTL